MKNCPDCKLLEARVRELQRLCGLAYRGGLEFENVYDRLGAAMRGEKTELPYGPWREEKDEP